MTYTVQSGDTISKIADIYLGDINLWQRLAEHNNISNPNLIYPGLVLNLDLPSDESDKISAGSEPEKDNKGSRMWVIVLTVIALITVVVFLYKKGFFKTSLLG